MAAVTPARSRRAPAATAPAPCCRCAARWVSAVSISVMGCTEPAPALASWISIAPRATTATLKARANRRAKLVRPAPGRSSARPASAASMGCVVTRAAPASAKPATSPATWARAFPFLERRAHRARTAWARRPARAPATAQLLRCAAIRTRQRFAEPVAARPTCCKRAACATAAERVRHPTSCALKTARPLAATTRPANVAIAA